MDNNTLRDALYGCKNVSTARIKGDWVEFEYARRKDVFQVQYYGNMAYHLHGWHGDSYFHTLKGLLNFIDTTLYEKKKSKSGEHLKKYKEEVKAQLLTEQPVEETGGKLCLLFT